MNIVPFEQALAEMITGLLITGGQNGDATAITKRANTALEVATAFTAINNGDPTGVTLLQGALANANLDVGVALGLQSLLSIATQQLMALAATNKMIPLAGATASAVAQNVVAGITAAAQAELAKYGGATPAVAK